MRSRLLTAAFFLALSSFSNDFSFCKNEIFGKHGGGNIFNLSVQRLSGERVIISWHTDGDASGVIYEVLRKHKAREQFQSLGVAAAEIKQLNSADYSFVDINTFYDSSYYCLKKTNPDSVVFYSITKGVEGTPKTR